MSILRRFIDRLVGSSSQDAPRVEQPIDLSSPSFYANPYQVWQRLREDDPAHRLPNGALLLTRHADIVAALSDDRLLNRPSRISAIGPRHRDRRISADVVTNILPFLDGSVHRERRKHLATATRVVVRAAEPEIANLARHHAQRFAASGGGDVLAHFATPYSFAVANRLFGFRASDTGNLARWSDAFFRLFAPTTSRDVLEETDTALAESRRFFLDALGKAKAQDDDTISGHLKMLIDSGSMSEMEAADAGMLIYADSVENVDALIANALVALQTNPAWMDRMMQDTSAVGPIVEEALRYDPPGQIIARIAARDCHVAGRAVRADMPVLLALGSANRDGSVWPEPNRFDPGRQQAPMHLAFGAGRHGCLGARLVRLKAAAALTGLAETCRHVELDPSGLEWEPRFGHRWLTSLTIQVDAR